MIVNEDHNELIQGRASEGFDGKMVDFNQNLDDRNSFTGIDNNPIQDPENTGNTEEEEIKEQDECPSASLPKSKINNKTKRLA